MSSRFVLLISCLIALFVTASSTAADELPIVTKVEKQPLVAATRRLIEAMAFAGEPFRADTLRQLEAAFAEESSSACARQIQAALDPYVLVDVVVNGEVAASQRLTADGHVERMEFPVNIQQSSWVAVRILPLVHTNPVWVHLNNQPVRASRRSAQWCIDAVEQCWKSKVNGIRDSERTAARAAYDKASQIYQSVLAECRKD